MATMPIFTGFAAIVIKIIIIPNFLLTNKKTYGILKQ